MSVIQTCSTFAGEPLVDLHILYTAQQGRAEWQFHLHDDFRRWTPEKKSERRGYALPGTV